MAVKKLFRNWNAGAGTPVAVVAPSASAHGTMANDPARRLAVLDDFEQAGTTWLWATDNTGALTYISEGVLDRLGVTAADLVGQPFGTLFETDPDNPGERSDRPLKFQINAHNRITDLTVRLLPTRARVGTRPAWWSLTGTPRHDDACQFLGYRGHARDITTEYERKIEDSRAAEFDSLTGLANRHRMDRRLDQVLAAFKSAKRVCTLMMLDLDRFKQVNDTMGHPAGDELLRQVAERLRRVIGTRGEIGRLGGDEFQVILPDLDDRGKLGELCEKVINTISQPYPIDGKRAVIGTSVGVAIAPYDGVEKDELVRAADLALYAAKNGGRGQFRFFSVDLKDEKDERRLIEQALRDALNGEELELHYQPVVRTSDNTVVGFEALMRWDHPERGAVGPNLFIPVAEESGLINQLGEWALRRACADAMAWPQSVRVAVNVSAVQFANAGFVGIVTDALAESGLAPERLELELTETVFMGDSEATEAVFTELKAVGVRLALDDFGTGYSSLSYLRSAPFDKLKVDKSFVDACTRHDQNSAKIIAAIIGLSDALGMESTVEGVEAFDQLELVCSKGARFIQGWIYSRALRQDVILERMASEVFRIEPSGPDRHRPERRSVFRRIGIIHDDHRYEAVMRDLSKTGARIEGLMGVPEGTGLVLDLGGGQLVVSVVTRSQDATLGIEFEAPLVSDGAGGLVTRHRVSPYALAAAGMPLAPLAGGSHPMGGAPQTKPQFMQVTVARGR